MIIISDKSKTNTIYIPRNTSRPIFFRNMVLHSRSSNKKDSTSINLWVPYETTKLWYKVEADLSNVPDGEYEYEIAGYHSSADTDAEQDFPTAAGILVIKTEKIQKHIYSSDVQFEIYDPLKNTK